MYMSVIVCEYVLKGEIERDNCWHMEEKGGRQNPRKGELGNAGKEGKDNFVNGSINGRVGLDTEDQREKEFLTCEKKR